MTTNQDTNLLLSEGSTITLVSGTQVTVERIRTRQMMKLLRILTSGAAEAISTVMAGGEDADLSMNLLAALTLAIPEAEDETVEFIQSLVSPVNLIESPRTRPERESNEEAYERVYAEFENPELDDLLSVIECVVRVEGPHLAALGKRIGAMLQMTQKPAPKAKTARAKSSSAT